MIEWEKCIRSGSVNDEDSYLAICGKHIEMDFAFVDVGHWFLNNRNKGRLVGCRDCIRVIKAAADFELDILEGT